MAGAAKVLEKYEQAIIDACANTGNRDFFYTAPDNDGGGFDPLYYLLCEPRNKRRTRRNRIVAKLRRYGYNKDGSKIKHNNSYTINEPIDNNNNDAQALPPPNPPSQQNNTNRVDNIESRDDSEDNDNSGSGSIDNDSDDSERDDMSTSSITVFDNNNGGDMDWDVEIEDDCNNEVTSPRIITVEYTEAVDDLVEMIEEDPNRLIEKLIQNEIIFDTKRTNKPPSDEETIKYFKSSTNTEETRTNGRVSYHRRSKQNKTIVFTELDIGTFGRNNQRFKANKKTHGINNNEYSVEVPLQLGEDDIPHELIPFAVFSKNSVHGKGRTTFSNQHFSRVFKDKSQKTYRNATDEEISDWKAFDYGDEFYFCMMNCSGYPQCKLPVYIEKNTFVVWVLIGDYSDMDRINKLIDKAYRITSDPTGFIGHWFHILVRYGAKEMMYKSQYNVKPIDMSKVITEDGEILTNKLDKALKDVHQYDSMLDVTMTESNKVIGEFLDKVLDISCDFIRRLAKHVVKHIGKYLTRDELLRLGWLGWGPGNKHLANPAMREYMENNDMSAELYFFILMAQSQETRDEGVEEIANILMSECKDTQQYNNIYKYGSFVEIREAYEKVLHPFSQSNERAMIHLSAMMILEVCHDGKIPYDMISLQSFHQFGRKKASVIMLTKGYYVGVPKDRHVKNLIEIILLQLKDDRVGDISYSKLVKWVDMICESYDEDPGAYFNEFAAYFGQIFQRGTKAQRKFVDKIIDLMIEEDGSLEFDEIGVKSIFDEWRIASKKRREK